MEECCMRSERRLFQHDVRSVCEIRNPIYWVGMADGEENRKDWESTERKTTEYINSYSRFG